MNKYYLVLQNIIDNGRTQQNKKGDIKYLINETLDVDLDDLDLIFKEHKVAKTKLAAELELYFRGETMVEKYQEQGIMWWDYCAPELINSYPTYFKKLPALIEKINKEKRSSKNYMFFIGETGVETNQLPCLSLMQFQISDGELFITVYQRSADSSLGLPSDLFQTYLISQMIDVPLGRITFNIGNAHIYANNIQPTIKLLSGEGKANFSLNV